jgi:hypothetical protein
VFAFSKNVQLASQLGLSNHLIFDAWVMKQMTTFDVDHEVLVGLRFRKSFFLSHVVSLKPKHEDD